MIIWLIISLVLIGADQAIKYLVINNIALTDTIEVIPDILNIVYVKNTGAAFIGMCALYLIYYKVKKVKIHIWQVTGLAGALAGFGFMCLSPGNFLRITTMGTTTNQSFTQRLIHIPGNYIRYIGVFAAIFLMLLFGL